VNSIEAKRKLAADKFNLRIMVGAAKKQSARNVVCRNCGHSDKQLRRGLCHACYERQRRAGQIESLVSARSAWQHIQLLTTAGWNLREIARAANMNRSLVALIVGGRERINAKTAVAICGISFGDRQKFQRTCWDTRRANKAKAQQAAQFDQQRMLHDRVAQRARQEMIMAQRRREAQHRQQVAHPRALPAIELPGGTWVDDALCPQVDPDLFFPEKGGSTRQAKQVCMECTVRQQCLAWALEHEERFGIWGGKSERERRRMLQEPA
jgi:WhiB family transcriptional regulator, redox-sensing transcriptional regulator